MARTFFTGVRGVLAPALGFHFVTTLGMPVLGVISAVLILVSILLLIPEIRLGKNARPATALEAEVSE